MKIGQELKDKIEALQKDSEAERNVSEIPSRLEAILRKEKLY